MILLQREVVILLLSARCRPLFELFLVPIHQKLELIELFPSNVHASLKRHHLVVELHFLLLHLLDVITHTRNSEHRETLHVLFSVYLFLLGLRAALSILHFLIDVA